MSCHVENLELSYSSFWVDGGSNYAIGVILISCDAFLCLVSGLNSLLGLEIMMKSVSMSWLMPHSSKPGRHVTLSAPDDKSVYCLQASDHVYLNISFYLPLSKYTRSIYCFRRCTKSPNPWSIELNSHTTYPARSPRTNTSKAKTITITTRLTEPPSH